MGQTRTDTANQRAAKIDGAARRRCPECGRGNALSRVENVFGRGRYCRYCGYERITDVDAIRAEIQANRLARPAEGGDQ